MVRNTSFALERKKEVSLCFVDFFEVIGCICTVCYENFRHLIIKERVHYILQQIVDNFGEETDLISESESKIR